MVLFFIILTCVALSIAAVVAVGIWRTHLLLVQRGEHDRALPGLMLVAGALMACQATGWFVAGLIFTMWATA